jgi:hypothetical protein
MLPPAAFSTDFCFTTRLSICAWIRALRVECGMTTLGTWVMPRSQPQTACLASNLSPPNATCERVFGLLEAAVGDGMSHSCLVVFQSSHCKDGDFCPISVYSGVGLKTPRPRRSGSRTSVAGVSLRAGVENARIRSPLVDPPGTAPRSGTSPPRTTIDLRWVEVQPGWLERGEPMVSMHQPCSSHASLAQPTGHGGL